jgi:phosphatidylinositol phospholipase C, gamma-1
VTLKEVKSFLPKINFKISTVDLNRQFQIADVRKRNEIGFDDFTRLYQNLINVPTFLLDCFNGPMPYSENTETVKLKEFQKFLLQDQFEDHARDDKAISAFIQDFVQDTQREVQEPYFTINEFVDYLFSKHNEIWDVKKCNRVYQDMTKPLCDYWINSSHNTYLFGDQFSSESSTEAYVRALRMGCRCIELDCWDGPDGPLIFHGHTFTTKIKFKDVIKVIKEHAFVTSQFPLILSIEQNCSLPQQRKMAQMMVEVFGDMLLTQPVEKNETMLPSPMALKRKIVLKHKKLSYEGSSHNAFFVDDSSGSNSLLRQDENELDIRNTIKNGILYLEDQVDKVWNPHFFVLTPHNKIYYTDSYKYARVIKQKIKENSSILFDNCRLDRDDARDDDPTESLRLKDQVTNDELHFGENWFHGKLSGGREEAER